MGKLGSDTYVTSFGHKESIHDVAIKHHQKAHIKLYGNAKEYIDQGFEKLKSEAGTVVYQSE